MVRAFHMVGLVLLPIVLVTPSLAGMARDQNLIDNPPESTTSWVNLLPFPKLPL